MKVGQQAMSPFDKLLRFDKNQEYCVIDFETEGLNLINAKPFQVSWIICKGQEIISEHDSYLFWEDLSMSDEAIKVTKFDWAHYKNNAKNPREVYDEFEKVLKNPDIIFIGQNILRFDIYILYLWQQLCGVKEFFPVERCMDTKALAVAVEKNISCDINEEFVVWQYKVNSIFGRGLKASQAHLIKKYKIPHDPKKLHNSLYDIKMTFEVFKKQLWEKCLEIPEKFWLIHNEGFK